MGYNSGMGEIFRKVAGISPIRTRTPDGKLRFAVQPRLTTGHDSKEEQGSVVAAPTCDAGAREGCDDVDDGAGHRGSIVN